MFPRAGRCLHPHLHPHRGLAQVVSRLELPVLKLLGLIHTSSSPVGMGLAGPA